MALTNGKIKRLFIPIGVNGNKFNVLDPRDLDAAFRFADINSGMGDRTGIQFANTSLNTKFKTSNFPSINDAHIGIYLAINQQAVYTEVGTYDPSTSTFSGITVRNLADGGSYDLYDQTTISAGNGNSLDARGWFMLNRTSNVYVEAKRNNKLIGTNTNANTRTGSAYSYLLGAYANTSEGNPANQSTNKHQAGTFGAGLTDTENAALFKIIQAALVRKRIAGAGNQGTLSSGAAYANDVPSVLAANRFSSLFSGNGDKMSLSSSIVFAQDNSLSFWFNMGAGGHPMFFTNSGNSNSYIYTSNGTTNITIQNDAGTSTVGFTVPSMSTGTWYCIQIVRNGTTAHLYLNGTESSSGGQTLTGDITLNQAGIWFDDSAPYQGYRFNGKISDIRKFDSAITSTDISNLAAGSEPVTNSSLHLKMNEGAGSTAWDYIM